MVMRGVRREKMRINPAAFLIEPDIEKTLITPTRLSLAPSLVESDFAREIRSAWSAANLFSAAAESGAQEDWSFDHHVRRARHRRHCIIGSSHQLADFEVRRRTARQNDGHAGGPFSAAHDHKFVRDVAAGDAMIFNSGKLLPGNGASSLAEQVESDVAIESRYAGSPG